MLQARDFTYLKGKLVGISDRMLSQHLELYVKAVEQFNAIQAAYPMTDWAGTGSESTPEDSTIGRLLKTPVGSLELEPVGVIADAINTVNGEIAGIGLKVQPNWYLGDDDFWTTDGGLSINIPWFLANPLLWRLANRQSGTSFPLDQVVKALRHEVGHVVGYAYEVWKQPEWKVLFGDMHEPYPDGRWRQTRDPYDVDHVSYLSFTPAHYAQKHPDEDWAETFAAWLDPAFDWKAQYAQLPKVLAKFNWIDTAIPALAGIDPVNTYLGKPNHYQQIKGTVGEELGTAEGTMPFRGMEGWSEHSELLRREPVAYNSIVLHEHYFENIQATGVLPKPDPAYVAAAKWAFGSWDSYLMDLRAICGSTNGWALSVWDQRTNRIRNVLVEQHSQGNLAGCPILLALDCWEHAYASDYGMRKDLYLGALFLQIDWERVATRFHRVAPPQKQPEPEAPPVDEPDVVWEVSEDDQPNEDAKLAEGSGGLVPVVVDVHYASGKTGKAVRHKRPEEAAKLIAEGKAQPVGGEGAKGAAGGKTAVPEGKRTQDFDVEHDADGDGVTDSARVGIPANEVLPPPGIPRLPNLNEDERDAESRFADAYEKNADAMVAEFREKLKNHEVGDAPNIYATDDAKVMSPDYNLKGEGVSKDQGLAAKGYYNLATHQVANAIAKKAFLQHMDELAALPEGDPRRHVLVTSGGVAAGKGFALTNIPEAKSVADSVGAVWDAAGEQNATENPWVLAEAKKRGLKATFVFVDSDPNETWEKPERGVMERAKKKGRMVDAHPYADSYGLGASNFKAFHEHTANDPDARFIILSTRNGKITREDRVPDAALIDRRELRQRAATALDNAKDLPDSIIQGGSAGRRVWGDD